MADYADVQSLDALRDLRASLLTFVDDAKIALGDAEFDIRRMTQWLNNDQPYYWKSEIKRWDQKLQEAKAALARKKMMKYGEHKPDTAAEEKKVRLCQARIDEATRKLALCKSLIPEFQHAVQEYRGQTMPLMSSVEAAIPKGAALLDKFVEALENYLRLTAPATQMPASMGVGGGGSDTMTREPSTLTSAATPGETSNDEVAAGASASTTQPSPEDVSKMTTPDQGEPSDERRRGGEQAG